MRGRLITLALMLGCSKEATRTEVAANVLADSSCDFVRVVAHPDPAALLTEFTDRDARGEFRGSNDWFNGAVDCPGHEPGPDEAIIVAGHSLRIIARSSESVRAEVTWTRIGYDRAGVAEADSGMAVDTLTAIRTPFGWRVASPALNPHMPPPIAHAR